MSIGKSVEERVGVLESRMLSAEETLEKVEARENTSSERIEDRLRRMETLVRVHTVLLGGIGTIIYYFMDQLVKAFVVK